MMKASFQIGLLQMVVPRNRRLRPCHLEQLSVYILYIYLNNCKNVLSVSADQYTASMIWSGGSELHVILNWS